MKYLNELVEGDRISAVYLCKKAAMLTTKNGKEYTSGNGSSTMTINVSSGDVDIYKK